MPGAPASPPPQPFHVHECRSVTRGNQCSTPRLHARSAEVLLIGKVLQTVLTEENISRALAVADDPGRYDEAREHSLTRQDLQEVREIPERFVLAAGGAPRTRHFLGRITTGIQIHAARAVIHYSIPLPEDSPLAGMRRQEIDLPEEILALVDNHGDLTAPQGNSWEASPILAETPGAWVTLSHRS